MSIDNATLLSAYLPLRISRSYDAEGGRSVVDFATARPTIPIVQLTIIGVSVDKRVIDSGLSAITIINVGITLSFYSLPVRIRT